MSALPAESQPRRLGEILIARGKLDAANLDRALRLQEGETREKIGVILNRLGLVSARDLADALSERLGISVATAAEYPELPLLEERVSDRFLRDAKALPLRETDEGLVVAMADPADAFTIRAIEMASGKRVLPLLAVATELESGLERLYGAGKSSMGQIVDDIATRDEEQDLGDIEHLKDLASEAPVIRLVNLLITHALESRASDIHVEPFENRLVVRYRIDGVLNEVESPPRRLSAAVISRVKIMANLDIAERRLPQDGRIKLRVQGKEIDLRVSTVPTMHGESVVMRILDKGGVPLDFASLGFDGRVLETFLEALNQPHGILLVTGPTGSGKTTTLYTALDRLNQPDVKILTVEDPVEYQMPGINQIQVRPQINLNFANALRSIVRQDPDVIMIGEIRDLETAEIAVQSALTGHLVLSTVHTNDAPSTVNRLLDMGVEDYLLTSTVVGILAQRLVRSLCAHCRKPYRALPEVVGQMGLERFAGPGEVTLYHPVGCEHCSGTGYHGRLGIMEMMPMTDRIRSLVMRHANSTDLRAAAVEEGMESMFENGLRKAVAGVTTVEEVLRVTRED
ncbi:MAG: type II secretion system protein GspE [Betaproteobacteria bacterium]|nr:type II secretion system protein GspE [Betaproteobacteria bacterium]PWB61726.1 MAG: type II secretion system protein GspE [Betaproteobacteria bacterium]